MTVNEFIDQLQNLKESLKEKEIVIIAENGIHFEPKIKLITKSDYQLYEDEINKLVITY